MDNKPSPQRPGVVLLLGLLLMAAITASTITISVVINRTLQQSRNLDNFILASLASDSGLERGLAVVKLGRQNGSSQANTLSATNISSAINFSGSSASLTMTGTQTVSGKISWPKLETGRNLDFDFLNSGTNPPNGLKITGQCTGLGNPCPSLLDVSWVVVDNSGSATWSGRRFLEQMKYDPQFTGFIGAETLDLQDVRSELSDVASPFSGSSTILAYRIRITALKGPVTNIEIRACDKSTVCGEADLRPIYGRIVLTATGIGGSLSARTQSLKTAAALWQIPSIPLLQYVVFSEESLIP